MNFVALLLTIIVGLFILFGSIIGLYYKNNKKITDFSISIAFGVIISLIVLEILPETYEVLEEQLGITRTILSIFILGAIGIVSLKLLDLFVPHHEHEAHHNHNHKDENCHNEHLFHIGIVSSIAVIFHNVIEGMSLYIISSHNALSGILLCIGIGLHNIPMGLVISSTLSKANFSKKKVISISLIASISTFIGGLIIVMIGQINEIAEGILLGLTFGMLLYISIFELAHQVYHMKNRKLAIIGTITGIVLIIISALLERVIH